MEVYVLDTSGIVHLLTAHLLTSVPCYTVPEVLQEVRSRCSQYLLEVLEERRVLEVRDPSPEYVRRVSEVARRTGDLGKFSRTDLKVVALALELRDEGYEVTVLTDDYSIMNVLAHLGIRYRPVRTRGIREVRTWITYCSSCGRPVPPESSTCPYCGSSTVRRRPRRSRS